MGFIGVLSAENSRREGIPIPEITAVKKEVRFGPAIRVLFWAALAILVVGLVAPLINAARFSGSIRNALQSSLGRPVEFGGARFSILSGLGFSLESVTIGEDPRYGIEPFAYVPTLEARLRLDKLLLGKIQFASLRLVDPSLNLVRNAAGAWNVVELMQRLSAPQNAFMNFLPAFEVSDGRVDFKLGTRKTTLYISESDLSIYPQRSGKIYIRFSGSPARTDRAGMGFGHFRGDVNWFLNSSPDVNRIQAELNLDPSNLSELTTLVEGHDVGVHGTVSSQLRVQGPVANLDVAGELQLNQVHRWDLLSSNGDFWTIHFSGGLDLLAHSFDLRTLPSRSGHPTPVIMRLHVANFLAKPSSSVVADLQRVPLKDLLPLAERMGLALPSSADLDGELNGSIGYSNNAGWNGGLVVSNAKASLENAPTLSAAVANIAIAGDRFRLAPTIVQAGTGGALTMSGEYSFADQQTEASFNAMNVPVHVLKPLFSSWFGGADALSALVAGDITGHLSYLENPMAVNSAGNPMPVQWTGQFDLANGIISVPGLAIPLRRAEGRVSFDNSNFDLTHLTANLGERTLHASYRYNQLAKHSEHIRIEFPAADLTDLEAALAAADDADSLWARLRFFRRSFPAWLNARNLDGELLVDHLFAEGQPIGLLRSNFLWQGAHLDLTDVSLHLTQGQVDAHGVVDLASFTPRWQFSADASGYPWGGGLLNAQGRFSSTGAGKDLLRNLTANGSFDGQNLSLSPGDSFDTIAGLFDFSFADGWPDLRLSNVQAVQDGDQWNGDGSTESDGRLLVDLAHAGRRVHFVSSLTGETSPNPLSALPHSTAPTRFFFSKLKF